MAYAAPYVSAPCPTPAMPATPTGAHAADTVFAPPAFQAPVETMAEVPVDAVAAPAAMPTVQFTKKGKKERVTRTKGGGKKVHIHICIPIPLFCCC